MQNKALLSNLPVDSVTIATITYMSYLSYTAEKVQMKEKENVILHVIWG